MSQSRVGGTVGKRFPGRAVRIIKTISLLILLSAVLSVPIALLFHLSPVFVLSEPLTIAATYLALTSFAEGRFESEQGVTPAMRVDGLAVWVHATWDREAAAHRLHSPYALPVRWKAADADLVEPWADILSHARRGRRRTDPPGWAPAAAKLAGKDGDLLGAFRRVPTERLVVLGERGAGKTMLLVRLVQDMLAERRPGDPVPFLVSVTSWDPAKQGLVEWLLERLAFYQPSLADPAARTDGGVSVGRELLTDGLIIPILDDLDQLPDAVRGMALEAINNALRPGSRIVVSCRTEDYRKAVHSDTGVMVRLLGAAGIELGSLDAATVRDYLRRDAGHLSPAAARWDPVISLLGTAAPVGKALRTPLMVDLARTIYNPRPGTRAGSPPDPAELCDRGRFPTPTAIREYLFDGFIKASYIAHSPLTPRNRWTPEQAEKYLVFLAKHQQRLSDSPDIAWWQLAGADSVPSRILRWSPRELRSKLPSVVAFGLGSALVFGFVFILLFGVSFGLPAGLMIGLATGLPASLAVVLKGVTVELAIVTDPRRVLSGDRGTFLRWLFLAPLVGLTTGLAFRSLISPDANIVVPPVQGWLMPAPVVGILVGLLMRSGATVRRRVTTGACVAVLVWFVGWQVNGLMSAFLGHIVQAVAGKPMPGLVAGLLVGLVAGVTMGIALGFSNSAWGAFTIARCRLALSARLPWRVMGFLADAHESRHVLRRAGAYYQFRHIELQNRLASRPE